MSSQNRPYSGLLRQPIVQNPNTTKDDLVVAEAKRLEALCNHFGIDIGQPGAIYNLVMSLARRHVPGFKINTQDKKLPKDWGRPATLDHVDRFQLQLEVEKAQQSKDPKTGKPRKITNAIYEVASQPPFNVFKPETVRTIYYRDIRGAKKSIPIVAIANDYVLKLKSKYKAPPKLRIIRGAFGDYTDNSQNRPKKNVRKSKTFR